MILKFIWTVCNHDHDGLQLMQKSYGKADIYILIVAKILSNIWWVNKIAG